MGEYYGLDLSRPAYTAQEAVQWVYMAYLAAVKEQDGAAMSLGNVSSFLDIYMEYELSKGTITESFAQELIDQFVIKLRMVRHPVSYTHLDVYKRQDAMFRKDRKHSPNKIRLILQLYFLGLIPIKYLSLIHI